MADAPLVSVAMITYKHRPYIGQALESVLAQKRDFPIEIVISDDCSPDGTAAVIDEYQATHPELFRRLDPPKNVGMHANLDRVWRACRGKYIAMLEGDDWWQSPDKLRTQVAFMERHPDCTLSGHGVHKARMIDGQTEVTKNKPPRSEWSGVEELLKRNFVITCSAMFRRGVLEVIPDWVSKLAMGDWPLCVLHALHGKVGYIDETLATYRVHTGGVWTSQGSLLQERHERDALLMMRTQLADDFHRLIDSSIAERSFTISYSLRDVGDYRGARRHLWDHIRYAYSAGRIRPWMFVKYPVLMLFPWIRLSRLRRKLPS
jgi:glycosyltransferase involved in cell wall biosynthesis